VVLRPLVAADEAEFLARARASRALHGAWVTTTTTPKAFRALIERMTRSNCRGFVVTRRDTGQIAGFIAISEIVMGIFRSGYLGYYAFAGFEGQGLMREGLQRVIRVAFGPMKLHRLEANIQPANQASIALVRACGFQYEGYSPRYLKIHGRWRDHERWALRADEVGRWAARPRSAREPASAGLPTEPRRPPRTDRRG
jgi:ribosomal-protein-alanine N-acetyltransferase